MTLRNWVFERLGYESKEKPLQAAEQVKVRTKLGGNDWVRVTRPKPIPEMEDDWHEIRKPRDTQKARVSAPNGVLRA
ncbi:hypothetical protein TruAng_008193 [Truncatella angustata]|nr:hypothetical protein TruAng_008193 [Truncatella angustata]